MLTPAHGQAVGHRQRMECKCAIPVTRKGLRTSPRTVGASASPQLVVIPGEIAALQCVNMVLKPLPATLPNTVRSQQPGIL